MHSDPASVKASLGKYWMIGGALLLFTIITVAVNLVHIPSLLITVTVALVIACMKGSMVAAVFMHLSNEKKWIYGALILTVIGFAILMTVPIFITIDTIVSQHSYVGKPEEKASGSH